MSSTVPQMVRREAGLVIFYPPASTLSITGLAQTQTDTSTVLSSSLLHIVLRSVATSRLRIVAVILRAGQSPLVVARLGLFDKVLSTFPH